MKSHSDEPTSCDVLIIGGGGASLRAGIEAKELGADVAIVSKSRIGYGNNTIISAGIFAATGWGTSEDGTDVHMKDTVFGGCFLNDQKLVSIAAEEATAQVPFLEKCGVVYSRKEGVLRLGHTPGHTYPRHLSTVQRGGRGLMLPLKDYAEKIGIRFYDQIFISRLFAENNQIQGAGGFSADGQFHAFSAKTVILATGGFGRIYQKTNNAAGITGDGHVLASDLGIPLKDMEFIQFYPTSLGKSGGHTLLYEAIVATLGAKLRNSQGIDILEKHGMKESIAMTRDRVTRAVMTEILDGLGVDGGVVLDLSSVPTPTHLKPFLPESWTEKQTKMIVAPTTHFCMGGIEVNARLETSISGLFATGEICGGVHGANRLGGNALAEVFAMGGVAGRNAAGLAKKINASQIPTGNLQAEADRLESSLKTGPYDLQAVRNQLKETMWFKVGILRRGADLTEALNTVDELSKMAGEIAVASPKELMRLLELRNMLLLSRIICQGALLRTESRGAHYRIDFPVEDNRNWLRNTVAKKKGESLSFEFVPGAMDYVSLADDGCRSGDSVP